MRPALKPYAHVMVCLLSQFSLIFAISLFKRNFFDSLYFDLAMACGMGAGVLVVARTTGMRSCSFAPSPGYCLAALPMGFLAAILDLRLWAARPLTAPTSNYALLGHFAASHAWWKAGVLMLPVCMLVPLLEETVFRGFLLGGLRARYADLWRPVLISSAIFALLHLTTLSGFMSLLNIFLLALVLAWLTLRTSSLWPAILLHAAYNSTEVVMLSFRNP